MGLKVIEVPEGGGTVKIITNTPQEGAEASPKPVAPKSDGGFLVRNKIFFVFILIGLVLLIGASLIQRYKDNPRSVTQQEVDRIVAVNKTFLKDDINSNKSKQDTLRSGQYYYEGNKGIIYCYPTVQGVVESYKF